MYRLKFVVLIRWIKIKALDTPRQREKRQMAVIILMLLLIVVGGWLDARLPWQ